MSLLSNGTIVLAGQHENSSYNHRGVILEYNANGTLNNSFGTSGAALDTAGTGWRSLTVLANGNLLVAGGSKLAEYTPTGTPMGTFGSSGIASLGTLTEMTLTVLSNGQILVAGWNGSYQLAAEKFNADGTPVTSFGNSGMATASEEKRGGRKGVKHRFNSNHCQYHLSVCEVLSGSGRGGHGGLLGQQRRGQCGGLRVWCDDSRGQRVGDLDLRGHAASDPDQEPATGHVPGDVLVHRGCGQPVRR